MAEVSGVLTRKTTAIDLGSTHSQMAQVYETSQDNGITWSRYDGEYGETFLFSDENLIESFPTVILRKKDLTPSQQQQISFDGDAQFGSRAVATANSFYEGVELISEFKKDFFCTAEQNLSDDAQRKYEAAVENTKDYLAFFRRREMARESIECTEERLILTVPVRATSAEREKMHALALEAGWKNVIIKDEATSVLNYFLSRRNSSLRTMLESKTIYEHVTVMIMDIGGSTTDLLLAKIHPDGSGGYQADIGSEWPDIGEEKTLGGIDIDIKLCNWLLEKEFLHPQAVADRIQQVGYKDFREFKENHLFNCLKNGLMVDDLIGDIAHLDHYGSRRNLQYSKNEYSDSPVKIDREVFLHQLVPEYLSGLKNAIRTLLQKGGVQGEEVDFLCLVGGGSQLYGIKEMLQGKLPGDTDPLVLPEIQKDIKRVLTSQKPSAVCALGNATPLKEVTYKHHCPYDWWLELEIYTAPVSDASSFDKQHVIKPNLPKSFKKIFHKQFMLAEEKDPLPITKDFSGNGKLGHGDDGNTMVYMISLFSRVRSVENPSNFQDYIQAVWTSNACRSLGRLAGEAIAKGMTKAEQVIRQIRNKEQDSQPYVYWDEVPWHYQISVSMDENRMINIQPSIKVKSYVLFDSTTKKSNG